MKKNMIRLFAATVLAFCFFGLSGCVVTTYTSGFDYNYAPPATIQAREFQNTGVEQPWGYRPVFW